MVVLSRITSCNKLCIHVHTYLLIINEPTKKRANAHTHTHGQIHARSIMNTSGFHNDQTCGKINIDSVAISWLTIASSDARTYTCNLRIQCTWIFKRTFIQLLAAKNCLFANNDWLYLNNKHPAFTVFRNTPHSEPHLAILIQISLTPAHGIYSPFTASKPHTNDNFSIAVVASAPRLAHFPRLEANRLVLFLIILWLFSHVWCVLIEWLDGCCLELTTVTFVSQAVSKDLPPYTASIVVVGGNSVGTY